MYTLNKKETQFVKDNFGSEQLFRSFCKDHFQFINLLETNDFSVDENEGFSTNGECGFTTGIVVQARFVDEIERMVLYISLMER